MSQLILRRTNAATLSTDEALAVVGAAPRGRVIHRSGDNVLVDIAAADVESLRQQLQGWIVSPQTERIAVPDTRRNIG
ncbi:hypothetical protein [Pseudoduganella aquatica]|uniref:Uncharacterized protein n=1 Tax=Pseudoduganella aquatica TaxID=2660641 RepID=A0A7X4KP10_9BURK|nr:hypothetical protein [Pseudoduganella aquatica]MYN10884.1 hypothetical protein [Pseudoduganella aquatica]